MFSMDKIQKNVLGEKLEECSLDPLTGWYRDGCCNTDENDHGLHTVCAKVTTEFLEWCKEAGNDLITPHPEFCLLYTSPSPRDISGSRMPSSA